MRYISIAIAAMIGFGCGWLMKRYKDILDERSECDYDEDDVVYLPVYNYPLKEI